MKTRNGIAGVIAASFLLVTALLSPAAAEWSWDNPTPNTPGVSLGGRASYFWPDAKEADNGNWYGGGQLRGYLYKWFGLEGSADYQHRTFSALNTDVDIYPVQLTGLIYACPQYRISPFLLGGVGWYVTHTHGPLGIDNTKDRFAQHVGAGVQFFMSRHWSVDATYRRIFTSAIDTVHNGQTVHINGDGHQVTGGINYHF